MITFDILSKVAPTAAKSISKKALGEIIVVTSVGAGFTNYVLEKLENFAKDQVGGLLESKKAELMEKKAALMAQAKKKEDVIEIDPEVIAEEEEVKKASKKEKKNK